MKLIHASLLAIALISACKKSEEKKADPTPAGSAAAPEEKKPEEPKVEEKKAEPTKAIISSCDHGSGTCTDYVDAEEEKKLCRPDMDGTLSKKPCPTAGLAGSCALPEGGSIRRYYLSGHTVEYAEGHCKNAMGGTFTAAK